MTDAGKRTPLYDIQKARGGRFVPFAGWEMPVQFAGVLAEHETVRKRVGLFDVSHMGEVIIEGPGALDAVQWIVTNDVSKLTDGKALYTVMCNAAGGIIDDLIVYRERADRYFICVNAGRKDVDVAHMLAEAKRFEARVTDVSDAYAQIAVQGPSALALIGGLTQVDVKAMPSFSFVDTTVGGVANVRIARTGYTGEEGAEFYVAAQDAEALYRALEQAGEVYGVAPCGLGARDTLRLEMKYPLYGNDIDEEHTPLEAGLGWVVKLAKADFLGKAALVKQKEAGVERKWVGFTMQERGIARQGYAIAKDGASVGVVTSGTHSPSLGVAIGTGYVPTSLAEPGTSLEIMIRDKAVPAVVVKTPFLQK